MLQSLPCVADCVQKSQLRRFEFAAALVFPGLEGASHEQSVEEKFLHDCRNLENPPPKIHDIPYNDLGAFKPADPTKDQAKAKSSTTRKARSKPQSKSKSKSKSMPSKPKAMLVAGKPMLSKSKPDSTSSANLWRVVIKF